MIEFWFKAVLNGCPTIGSVIVGSVVGWTRPFQELLLPAKEINNEPFTYWIRSDVLSESTWEKELYKVTGLPSCLSHLVGGHLAPGCLQESPTWRSEILNNLREQNEKYHLLFRSTTPIIISRL